MVSGDREGPTFWSLPLKRSSRPGLPSPQQRERNPENTPTWNRCSPRAAPGRTLRAGGIPDGGSGTTEGERDNAEPPLELLPGPPKQGQERSTPPLFQTGKLRAAVAKPGLSSCFLAWSLPLAISDYPSLIPYTSPQVPDMLFLSLSLLCFPGFHTEFLFVFMVTLSQGPVLWGCIPGDPKVQDSLS